MSNGFQKLGFPQPVPGQVLSQKHHYMGSQFFWPCLCEEQPVILCLRGRVLWARLHSSPGAVPQWLQLIPRLPCAFSPRHLPGFGSDADEGTAGNGGSSGPSPTFAHHGRQADVGRVLLEGGGTFAPAPGHTGVVHLMESLGGRGTKTIPVRKLGCAILPTSSSSFLEWEGILISVERYGIM